MSADLLLCSINRGYCLKIRRLEIGELPALDFNAIAVIGSPWNFLGVSVAAEEVR